MRLLQIQGDSDFSLVEYLGNDTPPYAILSHTWSDDEVTFKDFSDGTHETKTGYRKLTFCGKQAAADGLQFCWIDTCCIDKSSSAELSEAINSMFCWYQKAERCYVYLSDVHCSKDGDGERARWELAFNESRWFTRGWTLQELIAPKSVGFFSREGQLLGNKQTLEKTLHEITGVPIPALQGTAVLSSFSVEERMAWVKGRDTTREEDMAYSLLGIFEVYMPLLYGEGKEKALRRLQKEIQESLGGTATLAFWSDDRHNWTRDGRLSKIQQWLSAPDPSVNYQKALKQRQPHTGLWFLEGESYASWKTTAASRLWLYGIPGCGKSVLSSTVLQNVFQLCDSNPGLMVAYFYFDFKDMQKQQAEMMLRSLLYQLSRQCVEIPKNLEALFSVHEEGERQPSMEALLKVMHQIIKNSSRVYIMLDALDECAQRAELLEMLEIIVGWQLDNVHLIVTSRKERDIESSLEGFIDLQNRICLQSDVVDKDIEQYVRQRLSDDRALSKWKNDVTLHQEIETVLMRGSKGMFRWAVCQLDTLGKCRNRAMLRKSLAALPSTLDKTYDRILCAIPEEDVYYAMRILQWLAFSERPLSVDEVAEVVAIDAARNPVFDREEVLEDPLEALDICSSLVTIVADNGKQSAVLAHYSVKEYLVSDRIQKGQAARYSMQDAGCHANIAKGCLGYLGQFQSLEPMTSDSLNGFNLARYAAEFWMSHARKARDRIAETCEVALDLLRTENLAYETLIRLWDPEQPLRQPYFGRPLEYLTPPLCYAAFFGIEELVKQLLDAGADPNTQGTYYSNALQIASTFSPEQVVKVLLDAGANVNTQGGKYGNALQAASFGGNEQAVKLLLDSGAAVNAQGGIYNNALFAALYGNHEHIVRMLLLYGASPELRNKHGETASSVAVFHGRQSISELLIAASDMKSDSVDSHGRTLLWWAAAGGNSHIVQLLLTRYHSDPSKADNIGRTPLSIAAKKGHHDVIKIILGKHGEDMTIREGMTIGDMRVGEDNVNITSAVIAEEPTHVECDVCTSGIPTTDIHYHCNSCANGDWDICRECKVRGAFCLESTHVLVKRTMRDFEWVELVG